MLVLEEGALDGTYVVLLAEMREDLLYEFVLLQGIRVLRWFFGGLFFWLLCWCWLSINV